MTTIQQRSRPNIRLFRGRDGSSSSLASPTSNLAVELWPWPDRDVRVGSLDLVRSLLATWSWSGAQAGAKAVVRYLSLHTGLPALVIGALLVAIGYRVLKKTARFAIEVAAVTVVLALASELGWIRW